MTALAMHSYAYIFSLTHPILQSVFNSTDLAGSKRQTCAFKDEILYLYRSWYRYLTLGPDTAVVLYIYSIKKIPPPRYVECDCGYTGSESSPAFFL